MPAATADEASNIVLVHGGFVDGSGWQGVYDILENDGYNVSIVQNPTTSLPEDVAATQRVVDEQEGPVTLVGHSYGGAVITQAGNDRNVSKLVYIAGFVPDEGESVNTILQNAPSDAPAPPILPSEDGFLSLDKLKFAEAFAADVDPDTAAFMADSQVPWGMDALNGEITDPAWNKKPSWYLVTTEDRMIPPAAQRMMAERAGSTIVETSGSHSIYISNPDAVAVLIARAANA